MNMALAPLTGLITLFFDMFEKIFLITKNIFNNTFTPSEQFFFLIIIFLNGLFNSIICL